MARGYGAVVLLVVAAAAMQYASAEVSGNTLASLPFDSIIGGPLSAVVKAQAAAAFTTYDFVTSIGFESTGSGSSSGSSAASQPVMMEFTYGSNDGGVVKSGSLSVPLLTIVPIPFLKFDSAEVTFNAKLESHTSSSVTVASSTSSSSSSSSWGLSGAWYNPTITRTTTTTQSESHSSSTSSRSFKQKYEMRVYVRAVQADMPEGMAKVLDKMLEICTAKAKTKTSASGSV